MRSAKAAAAWLWSWLGTVAVGVLVGLVVGGALLWYFTVYDTAKGKCERGDVGACVIWQAQQRP